jgi:hypothetical protein
LLALEARHFNSAASRSRKTPDFGTAVRGFSAGFPTVTTHKMSAADITSWGQVIPVSVVSSLIGATVGGLITHRFTLSRERRRAESTRQRYLAALAAEIEYCAKLAATYVKEEIHSPLYRFPKTAYDVVYSTLLSEVLTGSDVASLISFYSQVDQMNRGLDAIDRHRVAKETDLLEREVRRLRAKATEMRHPTEATVRPTQSDFYSAAISAGKSHQRL